jgi:uncharacterized protein (TIGR03790 family)
MADYAMKTMRHCICAMVVGLGMFAGLARGDGEGDSVVVVYNRRLPESRQLAEYYALKRQVPTNQVFGFDLPVSEIMTRTEFQEQLQKPLFELLETNRLLTLSPRIVPATREHPGAVFREVTASKIRYATLCYGVPVRIASDTNLVETGMDKVRVELRRNEAAVDSELALLPLFERKIPLFGPVNNLLYGANYASMIHPTNGVLVVARLDGPSPGVARSLIDRALEAETNGLWGRAYFDARGFTNGEYKLGDEWIRAAAAFVRQLGFETVLDDKPATFSVGYPLSQVALYAGWYDGNVSGPFTRPKVEFMPGAVAYHLHSFSGHEIRTATQYWVGPLLEKGATATMGCVFEPYLMGTPNLAIFFQRLLRGFSFGEAAYASQTMLSWQTTVVGDPLYRPFARAPQAQHDALEQKHSKLIEWSYLRALNLNAVTGMSADQSIAYLEQLQFRPQSAVLEEKLAELYVGQNKLREAVQAYERARKLDPSPQQEIRIELEMARFYSLLGENAKEYALYQEFLKRHPDYPESLNVYQKLSDLARSLGKNNEAETYQREIDKLKPPTPPKTTPAKS